MTTEERKETLEKTLGTGSFISLTLPNGLNPGTSITISITDGNADVIEDGQVLRNGADQIIVGGYINNAHLHRRWIMAQMFKMLNYDRFGIQGYTEYMNAYFDNRYVFKMLKNEVHAIAAMEKEHDPEFKIRSSFFTDSAISTICTQYLQELRTYIEHRKPMARMFHGRPYLKLNGKHILLDEIEDKIIVPLVKISGMIACSGSYAEIEEYLIRFRCNMVKLPRDYKLPELWKDIFKGIGAYYTLQNMIRFHDIRLKNADGTIGSLAESEEILESKRKEYTGYGYKFLRYLKVVIRENNFDFAKRLEELAA